VAVQTGEGTTDILYGSTSIPAGPRTLSGYLARPDGEGEHPTVLVFGPEPLPLSSVKNICRILARHGIAALAPDLTGDHAANALTAERVVRFITNPSGEWSNAQFGFGVLAFGFGLVDAARLAADDGRVVAIGSVAATFEEAVVDDLALAQIAALWIGSRGDATVDVDVSVDAKEKLPQTAYVIYPDVNEGFWDDGAAGFDATAAADTVDRVVEFFGAELPPRV